MRASTLPVENTWIWDWQIMYVCNKRTSLLPFSAKARAAGDPQDTPSHSVFAGRLELVPHGQRDQGKSWLFNSLYEAYHNVAGSGFLRSQISRQALSFVAFLPCEKDANDTGTDLSGMPRQVSKSLICSGQVFFKISWQSRESSLECWQFRPWWGLVISRCCSHEVLQQQQWAGLLLRWKRRADTGTASNLPLTYPVRSQLLVNAAIFLIPENCYLTGTLFRFKGSKFLWEQFQIYFAFWLNLEFCGVSHGAKDNF